MADAATSPSGSVTADPAELAPPLTAATRLRLRELRIVPEGDDFLVGDPARGEFVAVPEVAVTVISLLRDGYTLGETAARVQEQTGEQVDVADFAATLVELGFVAATDGVPVDATGPELADGAGWARPRPGWRGRCTRPRPSRSTGCCSRAASWR